MPTMLDNWRRTVRDELDDELHRLRESVSDAREGAPGFSLSAIKENVSGLLPEASPKPVWEEERPWHARHRLALLVGLAVASVLFGLVMLGGGKSKDSGKGAVLYPDRLGRKSGDVEMRVGDVHALAGIQLRVVSIDRTGEIEQPPTRAGTGVDTAEDDAPVREAADGKTFLVVEVDLKNTATSNRKIGTSPFRIETAKGQLVRASTVRIEDRLGAVELVPGGTTHGNVVFEVPDEDGQYLIFEPAVVGGGRIVVSVDE